MLGHLSEHDFADKQHNNWNIDPFILFDATVVSAVPDKMKEVERNLTNEAKRADMLMIWTDCDREGEHIGSEIARVCQRAKRNIVVKRARFSAIIAQFGSILSCYFFYLLCLDRFIARPRIPLILTKHKRTP